VSNTTSMSGNWNLILLDSQAASALLHLVRKLLIVAPFVSDSLRELVSTLFHPKLNQFRRFSGTAAVIVF